MWDGVSNVFVSLDKLTPLCALVFAFSAHVTQTLSCAGRALTPFVALAYIMDEY